MEYMTIAEKIDKLNNYLANAKPHPLRLRICKMVDYDNDAIVYDAMFEYPNEKQAGGWGIEHVLGTFRTRQDALDNAIIWLFVNEIKY